MLACNGEAMTQETPDVFGSAIENATAAIAGIAASDHKELVLSLGYVFQRTRSIGFLAALKSEWEKYQKKGKIAEDYPGSNQHQECLQELLESLDRDLPDEIRFETLKAIFLVAATECESTRESLLPIEYLRVARAICGTECVILSALHRLAQKTGYGENAAEQVKVWLSAVAEEAGLEHPELIAYYEDNLVSKFLISERLGDRQDAIRLGTRYRLTSFGYGFCEFVSAYERIKVSN